MAASSHGDGDEEERRALELELAAELAELSARNVGFEEDLNDDVGQIEGQNETDYVRLDLDNVLVQMAEDVAGEEQRLLGRDDQQQVPLTSWELLLQSVERSDREFFQPCHETLLEIRTSILDVEASVSCGRSLEQQSRNENKDHTLLTVDPPSLEPIILQPEATALPLPVDEYEPAKTESNSTKAEETIQNMMEPPKASELVDQTLPVDKASVLPDAESISEESQHTSYQAKQKELQAIAKQHEARELRRLKTQTHYEKERAEAAQLLLRLQEEFEAQERNAALSRQEAKERSLMATEEMRSRHFAAAERRALEITLMTHADEDSVKFALELTNIQTAIDTEIRLMETEDQAERQRMQIARHLHHQKQKSMAQSHFATVLLDLVKYHEIQRQIRDQQTKRERRECVQMRAEDAYTRQIITDNRVLCEQQEREMNRVLMVGEDRLACVVEDLERKRKIEFEERARERGDRERMQQEDNYSRSAWALSAHLKLIEMQSEENSRVVMEKEEERCRCAWNYMVELERERQMLHFPSNVSAGFHILDRVFERYQLMEFVTRWKKWFESVEEDRIRAESVDNAAKRIQIWHRSCRQRLQQVVSIDPPLVLEDFSDEEQPQFGEGSEEDDVDVENFTTTKTQEAARRLQSTFRGFHVRRKFANAIALAQVVGQKEEGDCFDAVDLDDLIQLPPELVDGWEDPVLPPTSVLTQSQYAEISMRSDHEDHVDNNELVDLESTRYLERAKPANAPKPPKEQNLAVTLWNKMKRVKQRQQKAKQERHGQQDPVYRVQKLLNRKPKNRNVSNQNENSGNILSRLQTLQGGQQVTNTISWSSTTNAKKKAKVKLPSLVERLRKQTMSAR